jgi:hypothetical protein
VVPTVEYTELKGPVHCPPQIFLFLESAKRYFILDTFYSDNLKATDLAYFMS